MIKKRLGYFPLLYEQDRGTWPPTLSSTRYFEWQSWLWRFLSSQKDLKIIWNMGLKNSNVYDPLKDCKAPNIVYTTWKVGRALDNCDMVLVDFPSTIMLDVAVRKMPILCIVLWDHDWIRKSLNMDCIRKVKGYSEAFKEIKKFLADPTYCNLTLNDSNWLKKIW